ncbi:hypothetical protein N9406_05805 [Verrucomicrobiales bacterium]|nr:hypothetical protein [Verrucomicrobiales bacterium]
MISVRALQNLFGHLVPIGKHAVELSPYKWTAKDFSQEAEWQSVANRIDESAGVITGRKG